MKEPKLKGVRVEELATLEGKTLDELMGMLRYRPRRPQNGWKNSHWEKHRPKLREIAARHGFDEVITWDIAVRPPPEVIKHWVDVCLRAGMRQRPMAIAAKLRAAGVFCCTLDVTSITGDTRYPSAISDVYRGLWSDGHV